MDKTFAQTYREMTTRLMFDSTNVDFSCRGLAMSDEVTAALKIQMDPRGVSFFSLQTHRVTPIRFTLAELCWILAGRCDTESIASYNKAMAHYADEDDASMISGSYGLRLHGQLSELIVKLKTDVYTRQACAVIFDRTDCLSRRTHMPCNVFLQFLCRPPLLDLHVTSRSSDFVTGFSIDTIHWQALLIMMANELRAHGVHVLPNILYYNIASLHIYKADVEMVRQWHAKQFQVPAFEHFIPLKIRLSYAIDRAKALFTKDLTLIQLMDILGIEMEYLPMCQMLDELFQQHKNKLTR